MAGERVLIIEDDPTLLRGLKDNFAFQKFEVATANDGEAGLAAAIEGRPDLIILDVMMPKLNGFEICRRVREAELDMPIIMLTAKGQEEDIVRGLNLGADDYVTKPFSIKELLARSRAFLRRQRAGSPETYRFGDFKLDLASHRLFHGESEVVLSPKEFRLLELFVRRAGRALSRDEIMRQVWGTDVLVTSRSVDRCVTTLRGKIEADSRKPAFIQTIRDVGYRFEPPEADDTSGDKPAAREPEEPEVLPPGTFLGPYEIIESIGSGGMGDVYRARDGRLDREVALKVLPRRLARDSAALARFEREAKTVAALFHPGILTLYDIGSDRGLSFAVMELLEGETLRARIRRGPLDWREAMTIGIAVAEAVAAAHGKGVVHRDLKPSNVFLNARGGLKILDFGLAEMQARPPAGAEAEAPTLTWQRVPGTVEGTAGYMAPEQVRGLATDPRSDIFALGCVLYEMIAGKGPFLRATAAETLAAVLTVEAPELHGLRPDVPSELGRIIAHCLERDVEQRFQSASDLVFALKGLAAAG